MKEKIKAWPGLVAKVRQYVREDIWRVRLQEITGKKGLLLGGVRIFLIAAREFVHDKCPLRSSALTFYSLISIVPVIAMAFVVAKGFGLQNLLEKQLLEQFAGQQEVVNRVVEYAQAMLKQTRGGLLAGIGAVLLFWAVIRVFNNIEKSFNDIWGNASARTIRQKFSDYLSLILIVPLLLVLSGSATVLISSQVTIITEKIAFLGFFSPVIMFLLKLLPLIFIWILFTFIYMFMPNTRVNIKSGVIAGVVAGTVFKLLQWSYLYFQVGMSRYNAIYGSFAALPLFLIWLKLSWLIVLFGAELSFAHQNADEYELEPDSRQISPALRRILSLSVVHLLVKNFQKGETPLTTSQISRTLDIPIRLLRIIVEQLFESGLIISTAPGDGGESGWMPARDINDLTVSYVLETLDKNGLNALPAVEHHPEFHDLSAAVNNIYKEMDRSGSNVLLKNI
ncbi:MAG: YhjD/YihY/BrkB family envelope integrity protein [Desulfosudaceae bacterium]